MHARAVRWTSQRSSRFTISPGDRATCAWALPRSAIVPQYVDMGTVERSPLATIDELGVGELVRIAVDRGRAARPGLDYVSCSPFRVPIARVAAAQAAIAAPGSKQ